MASYLEENNTERARLMHLLDTLSADQLEVRLPNGWRVADALTHLAFWDRYALVSLRVWQRDGFKMPAENWEVINDVVEGMSRMMPLPALVAWVRESAQLCDACVEQLPAPLVAEIEAAGKSNFLFRATHRRLHLDQIARLF